MNNPVRYDLLKTLDDVKVEHRRIQQEITRKQEDLKDDFAQLSQFLTLNYWVSAVTNGVAQYSNMGNWIFMGYKLISKTFSKVRENKAKKRKKQHVNDQKVR